MQVGRNRPTAPLGKVTCYALRFPVRHFVQDDSMTMFIGPDESGTLIEVGVIEWHGAIAHAMRPARPKFLR